MEVAIDNLEAHAHRPMKHGQGYLISHWTLPSGNYSCIALADTMVINLCVKNELWRCEIAF
jgi:hypothetical protein